MLKINTMTMALGDIDTDLHPRKWSFLRLCYDVCIYREYIRVINFTNHITGTDKGIKLNYNTALFFFINQQDCRTLIK